MTIQEAASLLGTIDNGSLLEFSTLSAARERQVGARLGDIRKLTSRV